MYFLHQQLRLLILAAFSVLLSGCAYLYLPAGQPTATPGKTKLPSSAVAFNAPSPSSAPHIALLLPLQGPLAQQGQAIRNGFLAAYYSDRQSQPDNAPTVSVIDTNTGNIIKLYQQAVANGANFIVGPLTKQNVAAIASMGRLPVPTLVLNTLDNNANVTNLYQFGLSPNAEAEQVAERMRQDGYSRSLMITPASTWGQGIANAFAQSWQTQGGAIAANFAFADQPDYAAGIRNLLQFNQNKMVNGQTSLTHRQDVDVIFLDGFPQQARLLKPLLTFYYAGNIPVYATSLIYSGTPSPSYDKDLDGIIFCDMPWILEDDLPPRLADIRGRIQALWPDSYRQSARLYALGIDAYSLTSQMNQLSTGFDGATGTLFINQSGQILRRLMWAKMENGVPQILP